MVEGFRMSDDPHFCQMHYAGIRENHGKVFEVWTCLICGREEWTYYTGTQDTIEWRE